jgi:hypothetical protein
VLPTREHLLLSSAAAVGLVLPFVASGRHGLVVTTSARTRTWKPPIVLDAAGRQAIARVLDDVVRGSREIGLAVVDERQR